MPSSPIYDTLTALCGIDPLRERDARAEITEIRTWGGRVVRSFRIAETWTA